MAMCRTLRLLISCSLFSIILADTLGEPPCNQPRLNRTRCSGAVDVALGDGRSEQDKPNQCRIGCEKFSHPDIKMDTRAANCSFDLCDIEKPFRIFDFDTRICQPREMCIRACGEEPPGCVYSGTCRELTCFQDRNTGRPANFTRLTYAGPRSVVQVNNSKTSNETTEDHSLDAALISADICSDRRPVRPVRTYDGNCEPRYNRTFLSDNNSAGSSLVQCRTACRKGLHDDVEIVRIRTYCGTCGDDDEYACNSSEDCRKMCTLQFPVPEGCVFTGSCKSLICVSGIDSKLPAALNVSIDTGLNGRIASVDNDAEPAGRDPPVFMNYLNSVQVPKSTVLPEIETEDEIDNGAESEVNASDGNGFGNNGFPSESGNGIQDSVLPEIETEDEIDNGAESEVNASDGNGFGNNGFPSESGNGIQDSGNSGSKWTWLGPIIGLIGAIATAMAALMAAYITRKSANAVMLSSKEQRSDTTVA